MSSEAGRPANQPECGASQFLLKTARLSSQFSRHEANDVPQHASAVSARRGESYASGSTGRSDGMPADGDDVATPRWSVLLCLFMEFSDGCGNSRLKLFDPAP